MSVNKIHGFRNPIISVFAFVCLCANVCLLTFVANAQTPVPTPPNDDGPIIVNSDLVTLTVTVQDPFGRYVSGLQKKAFSVFENNQECLLCSFVSGL